MENTANPFRLDGQLALVTGGGTGIGFAICRAMLDAGARVVTVGRTIGPLVGACERLGAGATCLKHDLNNLQGIPELIERIEADYAPVDILVNNAGIHTKKSAVDTTDADLAEIMQIHVYASFALSRECGRRMMERRGGSIIMMLSMASLFGIPMVSAYSTAKSGLVGMTRALATEFSPYNVRVNGIAPGWIETDMSKKALEGDPERMQKVLGRTPMGRLGEPVDIGNAAVYLSSPAAKFVTGTVLAVDGGASIGF